jgi:hypothetical protein
VVPLAMIAAAGIGSFLDHPTSPRTLLAAALLVHYTQRSLIYPLLIQAGKPTPLVVWAMALVFCCWNGYLQVRRDRRGGGAGAPDLMYLTPAAASTQAHEGAKERRVCGAPNPIHLRPAAASTQAQECSQTE